MFQFIAQAMAAKEMLDSKKSNFQSSIPGYGYTQDMQQNIMPDFMKQAYEQKDQAINNFASNLGLSSIPTNDPYKMMEYMRKLYGERFGQ